MTVAAERPHATLHIFWPPVIPTYEERFFFISEAIGLDGHRHEYGFKSLLCENPTATYRCRKDPPYRLYERGDIMRARIESAQAMVKAAYLERLTLNLEIDYPMKLPPENDDDFPWRWLCGGDR